MLAENIKFRENDFKSEHIIGVLTHGNNGQAYIMVNSNIDNIGRKNFTIAHELGHYFLEHKLHECSAIYDKDISEDNNGTDPIEREADYFASCLLMPQDKIKNAFMHELLYSRKVTNKNFLYVNRNNWGIWCGIKDKLIKRYGVSETALRYRLEWLKVARFGF